MEQQGWLITTGFEEFLEKFGGVRVIDQTGSDHIHLLDKHLYKYRDFSQMWQEMKGEYLIPVGYSDLTRFYVSEQGKIYGDIRDVDIVQIYGNNINEGMGNLLNNRCLGSVEFYFDESRFE